MTTDQHTTPTPGSDEAYVREVLDSAMAGTRPPLDLSGTAMERGRRLRTRRRLAVAGTVAAAGALVAVVAPWLVGGPDGPDTRGSDFVATQPPGPGPVRPAGWWDMPATDMVSAVEAILPDGITVTDPGPLEADSPEGGPASGAITPHLLAPSGPGSLNVILYPPQAPGGQYEGLDSSPGQVADCSVESAGHTTCVEIRDADGTIVGRRMVNRWGGTVTTEVVLRRDGGGTVYAASANTLDDKWGADSPLSAERPPLTLDQLEDLVRNDVWVTGPGT